MKGSSRPSACDLLPSVDLAGCAVDFSPDVPIAFDAPLPAHHRIVGRWVATSGTSSGAYNRSEARRLIERTFDKSVLDILQGIEIADLRALVLHGTDGQPPALALICDSIGQIDLKWIEKSNILAGIQFRGAPIGWQAAAYKALSEALPCVLPVFGFADLFEELSAYYWDGESDDAGARRTMVEWHGCDPDNLEEEMLPSSVMARRPAWMLAENASPLKRLPRSLADSIRRLRAADTAVRADGRRIWRRDCNLVLDYMPETEERVLLPPMTIVPFDHFAREIDAVSQMGMEMGFMDVAGLCPLTDASQIEAWFASLKLGAELLLAAQALIDLDPFK